ncbi:MAG: energy transducer TonB [Proteobacteria bacterium]|nr:energy transducer TonB [Pseudomonadota bacterium]
MRITLGIAALLCFAVSASADDSFGESRTQPITPSKAVAGTHRCDIFYPALSTRLGHSGDVLVSYDVDTEGNITHVKVLKSSGYDELDNAAVACVATHWRSTPAYRGKTPIASPGHQAIIAFRLEGAPLGQTGPMATTQSSSAPVKPRFQKLDFGKIDWGETARSLTRSGEIVIGFFALCGLLAFLNWLFRRNAEG